MDWQSIESAPRDGTRILLVRNPTSMMKYRVVIGRLEGRSWRLDDGNRMPEAGLAGWQPLPAPASAPSLAIS